METPDCGVARFILGIVSFRFGEGISLNNKCWNDDGVRVATWTIGLALGIRGPVSSGLNRLVGNAQTAFDRVEIKRLGRVLGTDDGIVWIVFIW